MAADHVAKARAVVRRQEGVERDLAAARAGVAHAQRQVDDVHADLREVRRYTEALSDEFARVRGRLTG